MVVMKMTHLKHIPDTCDDCTYYAYRPHPYKGWSDSCELCMHCMDDDQEDDWIYDGDSRPRNCPLMGIPTDDVLDKIKGYVDHIRNTGMGKKKSLEFIEKFIEGLKAESEE